MKKAVFRFFLFFALLASSCEKTPPPTEESPSLGAIGTTLILEPSQSSASINAPVTFTATIRPDSPLLTRSPLGAVRFAVDGETQCGPVPVSPAATAACVITFKTGGLHTVAAYYSGDEAAYNPSDTSIQFAVTKIPTAFLNIDAPSQVPLDTPVVIQISLTNNRNSDFPPTSPLQIEDYLSSDPDPSTPRTLNYDCSKGLAPNGNVFTAKCTCQNLVEGNHTLKIIYPGDEYNETTSININISVQASTTTPSIFLGHTPDRTLYAGDTITFTATLGNLLPQFPLSGTVSFKNGSTDISGCHLSVSGSSTSITTDPCLYDKIPPIAPGAYEFNAYFTSSDHYHSNVSTKDSPNKPLTLTFLPITPNIALSAVSTDNPEKLNEFNLTASIKSPEGIKPNIPIPTGDAVFSLSENGASICATNKTATAQGIDVSCTYEFIPAQQRQTVYVKYVPDSSSYFASFSSSKNISLKIPTPQLSILYPVGKENIGNKAIFEYNVWDGTMKFQLTGKWFDQNISDIMNNITFNIDSIKYLSKSHVGAVEGDEIYPNPSKEINIDKCTHFEGATAFNCTPIWPIDTHFELVVTATYNHNGENVHKSATFDITIEPVPGSQRKEISNTTLFEGGCGTLQSGTRQKIFDCAMKVSNAQGHITYQGGAGFERTSYHFTKDETNFKKSWFLVNCPQNSHASACAWLSPELEPGNPATGPGEFLSYPNGANLNDPQWHMETYTKLPTSNRILWSGQFPDSFGFWNANLYWGYRYQNISPTKDVTGLVTEHFTDILQTHNGETLRGSASNYTDYCQNNAQDSTNPQTIWLPKTGYTWKVPSYPQIMALTGAPQCNGGVNGAQHDQTQYACLDVNNGMQWGFSASFVPGFYTTNQNTDLWSSALATLKYYCTQGAHQCFSPPEPHEIGWKFSTTDGKVVPTDNRNEQLKLRCASMDW